MKKIILFAMFLVVFVVESISSRQAYTPKGGIVKNVEISKDGVFLVLEFKEEYFVKDISIDPMNVSENDKSGGGVTYFMEEIEKRLKDKKNFKKKKRIRIDQYRFYYPSEKKYVVVKNKYKTGVLYFISIDQSQFYGYFIIFDMGDLKAKKKVKPLDDRYTVLISPFNFHNLKQD